MKISLKLIVILLILSMSLLPAFAFAREGDCGYEGGISSGEAPGKTSFEYQEVCFITGQPIIFKGTLTVKKSLKQDTATNQQVLTTVYTYSLRNIDKAATLSRTLTYNTVLTKKDNGQTIEETTMLIKPVEIIKASGNTYTLSSYEFTRTNIIDSKPAVNYYAGNTWGKKIFLAGTGAANAGNAATVTIETTGSFYGYDQYWSTTEVILNKYVIQGETKNENGTEKWGGTAEVNVSSTTTKQLKYIKNEPRQISFEGGYVQIQSNRSVLEYRSMLPEFDQKNIPTDNIIPDRGTLKLETFPVQKRLPVMGLNQIKGHWAENEIRTLFSLEVLKDNPILYEPEQYLTRSEFIISMLEAAREAPLDPIFTSKTTAKPAAVKNTKVQNLSPFSDVSKENLNFNKIDTAFKRGFISGRAESIFGPEDSINLSEAVTICIRALGLAGMAPNPAAVTLFKDNDQIPDYARNSIFVAEKIGLIQGDERGCIYPLDRLTKGSAAVLISRFVDYMREGIGKDYNEGIIDFK